MTISSRWSSAGIVLSAGLLAVTGCGDSSDPGDDHPGVSFTYAGVLHGNFQAVGPASVALDPSRSFAVAFRSEGGELQLCAYQATIAGYGNFLLLNAGAIEAPGEFSLPPAPVPVGTGYQAGTFLVGVDSTRSSVRQISQFVQGSVKVDELSTTKVRGTFAVTTRLSKLTDGRFDVPIALFSDLPILCS
jgi:hypothetical protein